MNDAVRKWLKPGGRTIPKAAVTTAELVCSDYAFHGLDFRLIHFEEYGARTATAMLSESRAYHRVDFGAQNAEHVQVEFPLRAVVDGKVNGLRLRTKTTVADGIELGASPWFNPPLVLPFEDLSVRVGDEIHVRLAYGLGTGFSGIEYDARKAADNGSVDENRRSGVLSRER
jgi:predicted RNA methylase